MSFFLSPRLRTSALRTRPHRRIGRSTAAASPEASAEGFPSCGGCVDGSGVDSVAASVVVGSEVVASSVVDGPEVVASSVVDGSGLVSMGSVVVGGSVSVDVAAVEDGTGDAGTHNWQRLRIASFPQA